MRQSSFTRESRNQSKEKGKEQRTRGEGKNAKQSDHSSAHHWAWQSSQFAADVSHQEPASAYAPQVGHQSPSIAMTASNSVSAVDHQQQRPPTPPLSVGLETGFGVGAKMGRGVGAGSHAQTPPSPLYDDVPHSETKIGIFVR